MDHRRIEWLLLLVFSLVSIYLGFEIIHSPVSLSSSENNGATNIRSEMKSDNISVPRLSDQLRSGYYLAAKDDNYLDDKVDSLTGVQAHYSRSTGQITASPKARVPVAASTSKAVKELSDFKDLAINVAYGKDFVYEPQLSSKDNYVFVQDSPYGKIYDAKAQLSFTIKDGSIDSYTESYLGPVKPVRELQSTISSWRAVQAMYTDRQLSNNSRIIKMDLAYSKLTNVRGSNIFLPVWIAWVENKNTGNVTAKKVNAFTAQMLQPNAYSVEK